VKRRRLTQTPYKHLNFFLTAGFHTYMSQAYMASTMLDRELKKGSAELLILSLVDDRPRHGYDIGQLIELRSRGVLRFNVASLYPLLYRLEGRGWIRGRWVERAGQRCNQSYYQNCTCLISKKRSESE